MSSIDARRVTAGRRLDALLRETVPGFVNFPPEVRLHDRLTVFCAWCGEAQTVLQVRLNKTNDGKYSICCDDNLVQRPVAYPLDRKTRRVLQITKLSVADGGVTSAVQSQRGDGTTTGQMKASVQGAVYVWCNDVLHYPYALAKYVGRSDLLVVSPYWLSERRWQGKELAGIVIDHATELSGEQFGLLQFAAARIRRST